MKIIRAEITGFGHYRQQTFDFVAGNQLLFGQNEEGKSTLYHFIQAMLFGFPKKSQRKRDYTPRDGAAFGGKLYITLPTFGEVVIERYRQVNRGKAHVICGEQTGDDRLLAELIAPLTQTMFQQVFTFQQEQLAELDHLQEKELHAALMSIGMSGSQAVMQQMQKYGKENQQLYKPRGQKLVLNQRLQAWQQLQLEIHQKESQEHVVQQAYLRVQHVESSLAEIAKQRQKCHEVQQQLAQQELHWSLYEEWQQLRQVQSYQASASLDQQQQLAQFYADYQQLTAQIQEKETEIARVEHQQTAADRYFFYLDHEHDIQQLLRQQLTIGQQASDYTYQSARYQQLSTEIAQLEQHWGWSETQQPQAIDPQVSLALTQLQTAQATLAEKQQQLSWLLENEPLMQQTAKPLSRPFLFSMLAIFLLSWVLPAPLRYGIWLSLIGVASYVVYQQRLATHVEPKNTEKVQQEIVHQQRLVVQLTAQLQPVFGQVTDTQQWPTILENYDKAMVSYVSLLAESREVAALVEQLAQAQADVRQQLAFLSEWLPLGDKSLPEQLSLVGEFADEMQALKMERLQQPSTLLAQQLNQLKQQRTADFQQAQPLLQAVGIETMDEVGPYLKQWQQQQQAHAREVELAQLLTPLFPEVETSESLVEKTTQNQAQQQQLRLAERELIEEQQRTMLEIQRLQQDGTLDLLYQEAHLLKDEIQQLVVTWGANQTLLSFLDDVTTTLSEQQLPQLLQQTSKYFHLLTNGHYEEVTFVDGVLVVQNAQDTHDIYHLSTGTKDQLVMALRFAYLSLQAAHALCPVIIDDGWLHYDHERKAQLAQLFQQFGEEYQVICLSSDQEMVSYYQRLAQPVTMIGKRG